MNGEANASPSSAPASPGLASAWLLGRRHAVTLFEAGRLPRRPHAHGRRDAGRRHAPGGHRLPGLQRPHLSAPDRAVRRARRDERAVRHVVLGQPRRAATLEWAGTDLATRVRAAAQLRCAPLLARCSPTSCASTARRIALAGDASGRRSHARRVPRRRRATSAPFRDWYLLPMAAAIWSCPTGADARLPAARPSCASATTTACCRSPTGRSGARCSGGAREYVQQASPRGSPTCAWRRPVQRGAPSTRRRRASTHAGGSERFDEVVLACHSDQALALLADARRDEQRAVLGAIRYQPNRVVLHTDARAAAARRGRGRRGTTAAGERRAGRAPGRR